MASGSFNLTRTGETSRYVDFLVNWSSTSNGGEANSSTVHVAVYVTKQSASTSNTWGTTNTTVSVTDSGTHSENGISLNVAPNGSQLVFAWDYIVPHNADGTKEITISVDVGGNVVWGNGSQTVTLEPILATITQFKATTVTDKSVALEISTDVPIDYIYYSLNDGEYSLLQSSDGKGTITGLDDDTTYSIKVKVRRMGSQLWTFSEAISVTTLKSKMVRIRLNGTWKEAISYLKINGTWKEAKPYIKVGGVWKEGV